METEFSLEGITIAVKRYRQLHLLAAELMFDVFSKAQQLEQLTQDVDRDQKARESGDLVAVL